MVCPHCGFEDYYEIRTRGLRKCKAASCRKQYSPYYGTALHSKKKPVEWYLRIIELHEMGYNPYRISKMLGQHDAKSVYDFLRRWKRESYSALT